MCQRQIVVIEVCHHQSTGISGARWCRVAGMMAVTCRHVRLLDTQIIDTTRHRQAVSF